MEEKMGFQFVRTIRFVADHTKYLIGCLGLKVGGIAN